MCQSLILPWNFFPRLPIIRDADRGVRSGKIKVTLVLSDRLRCSVTGRGHFLYNRSSQLRNRSILLATGGQLLHLQLRWTSDTRYIGKTSDSRARRHGTNCCKLMIIIKASSVCLDENVNMNNSIIYIIPCITVRDTRHSRNCHLVFLLGELGISFDGDLYDVPAREHNRSDEE